MIPHSKPFLGAEEQEAAARVLASGRLAEGEETAAFERECAAFCGRRYGIAVSSGTAALHLALGALGVGAGDSVAMPSYACAALLTAVRLQGADAILCDVDDALGLEPSAVPGQCAAAIAAHMFGARARMPRHDAVVEDIAQRFDGSAGRATRIAVTSFYATKLITTGEGGMVFADDPDLEAYVRDRHSYDNRDDFIARYPYKMTDFQAAVGRVQLRRLPAFLDRRRRIAAAYNEAFADLPLRLPDLSDHACFRYVVATPRRDALEAHLAARGIEAKRPVYRPAHHYLGGAYPNAERAHDELLSLPIYPALIDAEIGHVIESVRRFF